MKFNHCIKEFIYIAVKDLKSLMTAIRYLQGGAVAAALLRQKQRIAARLMRGSCLTWCGPPERGISMARGSRWDWSTNGTRLCGTRGHGKEQGFDLAELKENYVHDFTRSQADKQEAAVDPGSKTLIGEIEKLDEE